MRVESGLDEGQDVGVHYDPLLAKIVASGATRDEARRRLSAALGETVILGVATNVSWLRRLLETPEVAAGAIHTGLLETLAVPAPPPPPDEAFAAAAAALSGAAGAGRRVGAGVPRPLRRPVPGRGRRVKLREASTGETREVRPGAVPRGAFAAKDGDVAWVFVAGETWRIAKAAARAARSADEEHALTRAHAGPHRGRPRGGRPEGREGRRPRDPRGHEDGARDPGAAAGDGLASSLPSPGRW